MDYQRRLIDSDLDVLLPHLAAIAIEGAKGVGKTATARQRASTVLSLDDASQQQSLAAYLDYITEVPPPVLIDEWQLLPEVWDRVRRAVDAGAPAGSFLLTGSAGVVPGTRIHSGAGRIVSKRMRPMSLVERGVAEPTVSLEGLLEGGRPEITGTSSVTLPDYVEEILRSGFPGSGHYRRDHVANNSTVTLRASLTGTCRIRV